jgi:hypothetical protein
MERGRRRTVCEGRGGKTRASGYCRIQLFCAFMGLAAPTISTSAFTKKQTELVKKWEIKKAIPKKNRLCN